MLGAATTGYLGRLLGPLPAIACCAIASGAALILLSTARSMPVMMAANLLYTWAIVAASVTLRALRQLLVPRELLGRVTAAWRLATQIVTPAGAVAAGALTAELGGDPRPVFAVAGVLTIRTVAGGWAAGVFRAGADGECPASTIAR